MATKDSIMKHRKKRSSSYPYIAGKRFNPQEGDKAKASFIIKLLPRVPDKPSEICDGPFYIYYVHFGLGIDGMQHVACLNKTEIEFKQNKRKCPACSWAEPIIRDKEKKEKGLVDKAFQLKGKERSIWLAYDLNKRKEVEFFEVGGKANDSVIDKFCDDAGEYLDLTDIKNKTALKIVRTGSGKMGTTYEYSKLQDAKYSLTRDDIIKIKKGLKWPEKSIVRLDKEEFNDLFKASISDIADTTSDLSDLNENDSLDSLGETEDLDDTPKKEKKKAVGKKRADKKEETDDLDLGGDSEEDSLGDKPSKEEADLESELDDLDDL